MYHTSKFYKAVTIVNASLLALIVGLLATNGLISCATVIYVNGSYIESINLQKLDSNQAKAVLDDFNAKGGGAIVRYGRGYRPITIIEAEMESEDKNKVRLGQAIVLPEECVITLNPKYINNYKELREVLIHEYLHCFNYSHTDKENDLMYATHSDNISEENIDYYANELKRRLYGRSE